MAEMLQSYLGSIKLFCSCLAKRLWDNISLLLLLLNSWQGCCFFVNAESSVYCSQQTDVSLNICVALSRLAYIKLSADCCPYLRIFSDMVLLLPRRTVTRCRVYCSNTHMSFNVCSIIQINFSELYSTGPILHQLQEA